jgi:adenylate kinase family enzyme
VTHDPTIEFAQNKDKLYNVDASGSIEEVFKNIQQVIDK